MRRAARLRPGIGTATIANVTWVSLFTVLVIEAQVKPGRFRMVKHRDFHNVPTAGDLGCGKSRSAGRLPGAGCRHGVGKRTAAYVHTLWTNLWTTSCG